MTEKEAWQFLARSYARRVKWLFYGQSDSRCFGICTSFSRDRFLEKGVRYATIKRMEMKIPNPTSSPHYPYVWDQSDWESRAAFCRQKAKECKR